MKTISTFFLRNHFIRLWVTVFTLFILMLVLQQNVSYFTLNSHWITQPWRLWTGHLVHINWQHFALNGLGLIGTLMLFNKNRLRILIITIFVIAPILSLILLNTLLPNISYYGFSGLLHTLVISLAIYHLFGIKNYLWSGFIIAIVSIKLLTDYMGWNMTDKLLQFPIAYNAHYIGAILGGALGIILSYHHTYHHSLIKSRINIKR